MPSLPVENGVLLGSDGWLFLFDGSNEVGNLFSKQDTITQEEIQKWQTILRTRQETLSRGGAIYLHFCVPDKLSIYREQVPMEVFMLPKTPAETVFGNLPNDDLKSVVVDLAPAMRDARKHAQLYWRTDTHWTFAGACTAYRVLCEALETNIQEDLLSCPETEVRLALDLGSKLNPQVTEVWRAPQLLRNSKLVYRNPMVRFLDLLAPRHHGEMHCGTSVGFQNHAPSCDPRRVLIFGDSYFEYRPHSMTGLFAETFREVRFVWSSSIDYALVAEYKPDIVITEMAERFVRRIPDDSFCLRDVVNNRICSFLNSNCRELGGAEFEWRA